MSAPGLIVAAPASGSGKSTLTLALLRALRRAGIAVASFKVGPDYIDPMFHARASGRPCVNLDSWAMRIETLAGLSDDLSREAALVIGEGVMGLTRAFMYAGAPTVGVSLWSVADRSTAELMTDFYRTFLGPQPSAPASAMRSARLSMIAGKRYSAPFYWAPFVLVGDWK